jgi:hypothetical protein
MGLDKEIALTSGLSGDYWVLKRKEVRLLEKYVEVVFSQYNSKAGRDSGNTPIEGGDLKIRWLGTKFPGFLRDPKLLEVSGETETKKLYELARTDSESQLYNATDVFDPMMVLMQGSDYIDFSSGEYNFGDIVDGQSSSAITFTIKNSGDADLTLSGSPKVDVSGTDASQFSVNETSTSTPITEGNTTTFTITFSPTSEGAKEATASITNNDGPSNPFTFTLKGNGTAA